jgi:hypothetical protein
MKKYNACVIKSNFESFFVIRSTLPELNSVCGERKREREREREIERERESLDTAAAQCAIVCRKRKEGRMLGVLYCFIHSNSNPISTEIQIDRCCCRKWHNNGTMIKTAV